MSLLATPSSSSASTTSSTSSTSSGNGGNGNANNSSNSHSGNNLASEKDKIWYFSHEQLANSPSRRCGIKADDELHYRQMTAYLIQEMGQRLQVSQLCINTAIVYMHRFYAFHSFTHFHRNSMASASLFLAAKVEEQPRKLEHVIRAANKCVPQPTEQNYADHAQELVFNENVLLQTLGFDVAIDHPHTHVVRTCQLVKACKDLAQTSYFLASNSLHLTSMCLQYRPTVVACFCIYLACKWSRWEIPQSTEGKHWFYYVDKSVSHDLLKQLTDEFIAIYEKSPARLKSKLNSIKAIAQGAGSRTGASSKDNKPKEDWKMSEMMKGYHSNITAPPELMNGNENREPSSQQVAALLPPPAMPRRSGNTAGSAGDHSNHQRTSVGTSSGNIPSNHKLPNYPGALPPDAHADHKSKQPNYSNRAPSSHQSSSSSNAQRSGNSGSNSNMSSSSSSSNQRNSASTQQSRPQMPMDYHKSSRGMPVGLSSHVGHKMPTKQPPLLDSRSSSSSSTSGGLPTKDGVKSSGNSSSTTNKIYPNPPPPYNNSASNSLLHGSASRGSYMPGTGSSSGGTNSSTSNSGSSNNNNSGSNGVPTNSSGYHTHRNKSSSSSSSVHSMPPYELPATIAYGQSASNANVSNAQHMAGFNSHMQMPMDVNASGNSAGTSQQPPGSQQSQQQIKNNSLFSPEWTDIKKDPSTTHYNGMHDLANLGFKLNIHVRDKDSPKKDRITNNNMPTKKEKHRTSGTGSLPPTSAAPSTNSLSNSHGLKAMLPPNKKPNTELMAAPNELAGSSREGTSGLKRANELQGSQYGINKLDEESTSRDKIRKLENTSLPGYGYNSIDHEKHTPLSMSNVTPDLVRSLLKESLCTPNASLLKPDALTMPGPKPPAELLEPMPMQNLKKDSPTQIGLATAAMSTNSLHGIVETEVTGKLPDISAGGKAEKKKKKEKHKHKEKDKSKDKSEKEERKKHKKDKQKERSKDMSGIINPNDSLKLVIKAPRIPNGLLAVHQTAVDGAAGQAAPLKLKISKNKVEPNYSMAPTASATVPSFGMPATSTALIAGTAPAAGMSYAGYGTMTNVSASGSSSSSSGRKRERDRDRDRERDKEKKSKNQDYAKYNGVSGYATLTGVSAVPTPHTANMVATTTAMTTPSGGMLMNPGMPPAGLPVYSKK